MARSVIAPSTGDAMKIKPIEIAVMTPYTESARRASDLVEHPGGKVHGHDAHREDGVGQVVEHPAHDGARRNFPGVHRLLEEMTNEDNTIAVDGPEPGIV